LLISAFSSFIIAALFQGALGGAALQHPCQGRQPEGILYRKQKKVASGLGTIVQSNCKVEVLIESFYFCYM